MSNRQPLKDAIALVAGATRGAGRGIAIALGEAGATVYCSGRSTRGNPGTPGRPETIEETAEMVTAAGGRGIAVRTDHSDPAQVKELVAGIKGRHEGLDILVNDIWGGDVLTEFDKRFWDCDLEKGLRMLQQAVFTHIITAHAAAPLMLGRERAIIFEITDGEGFYYRGNLFYDLVKVSVIRMAYGMALELRKSGVIAIAVTPGFLRSEAILEQFGVTEETWRSAVNDQRPDFLHSETPRFVGRAVAALAADPLVKKKSGRLFSSWALAHEYGFTDMDGSTPDWGAYATKTYGECKICDDSFYGYWDNGLIEKAFPDWF